MRKLTQYLKKQKGRLNAVRVNRNGRRIPDKVVVLESDDWGAIRTSSKAALDKLEEKGIYHTSSIYQYDSLASASDLEGLFEVLACVRDHTGNPAALTANTIVANPDFKRIEQNGFREYHYEPCTETMKRYPEHENNWALWQEGMRAGLFKPQLHGREHLNISRWLKALQSNRDHTRFCFNLGMTYSGKEDYSFMEALDWDDMAEENSHERILREGAELFKQIFGYSSLSFIAPCYNWSARHEQYLAGAGVEILQGRRTQLSPTGQLGRYRPIRHGWGEKNGLGQYYNIRNVFFEPSSNPRKDWVDAALAEIRTAFQFGKPAVVCTHRVNYVGFIDPANRSRGLNALADLLKTIVKTWPEVRFLSTDQLYAYWHD